MISNSNRDIFILMDKKIKFENATKLNCGPYNKNLLITCRTRAKTSYMRHTKDKKLEVWRAITTRCAPTTMLYTHALVLQVNCAN